MTSQCPRCGAPRMGDFCHNCGLDFKQAGGQAMPPQQQLPPSQPIYSPAPPPQPTYNPAPPPQAAGYYTQARRRGYYRRRSRAIRPPTVGRPDRPDAPTAPTVSPPSRRCRGQRSTRSSA